MVERRRHEALKALVKATCCLRLALAEVTRDYLDSPTEEKEMRLRGLLVQSDHSAEEVLKLVESDNDGF